MKIEEMVEEINEAAGGTLTITHYMEWDLHSYGNGNLFSIDVVKAKSFKGLIEKAYRILKEGEIKNGKESL